MNYIISSHSVKTDRAKFVIPNNVTLKFYCAENGYLTMARGYAVFGLIYNWAEKWVRPVEVKHGGETVDDYDLWNGNFRPLAEDKYQDVNGIFSIEGNVQLPCIYDMSDCDSISLKDAIQKCVDNTNNGEAITIHCLFCRA